jgi:hypothetical protein
VIAPQTTLIKLDHNFITGLSGSKVNLEQRPQPEVTTAQQWIPPPVTPKIVYVQATSTVPPKVVYLQQTAPYQSQIQNFVNVQQTPQFYPVNECGVPTVRPPSSTGLVIHGRSASRGQFPW